MANPILPFWEYIPDGEPRVFGDRVYLYGSHDRVGCGYFCDYKLKVWSAPVIDLNHWQCHGTSFQTRDTANHASNTPWTDHELYAPDCVEKDGRYYLYMYIFGAKGCVGVSDHPEGPFELLSKYEYRPGNEGDEGIFNDVGVLVDDDGRVYCYYGFEHSHMNEINPENMYEILDGSLKEPVIDDRECILEEIRFYEASSPRKINGLYYLIYSPRKGSRLAYATSESPTGPFTYRGYIIDNGVDYPAGNNHGSVCNINGQWYVFYHRMTNHSIMSRRACVEKIEILPDGTIPPVEMTSLGFEDALNPYELTPAEIACVLKGEGYIIEKDAFTRVITNIKADNVIGYKYFDFGQDYGTKTMILALQIKGTGSNSVVHVHIDAEDGPEIGSGEIGLSDGVYKIRCEAVTGRHALYLVTELPVEGWTRAFFEEKTLFELQAFTFFK